MSICFRLIAPRHALFRWYPLSDSNILFACYIRWQIYIGAIILNLWLISTKWISQFIFSSAVSFTAITRCPRIYTNFCEFNSKIFIFSPEYAITSVIVSVMMFSAFGGAEDSEKNCCTASSFYSSCVTKNGKQTCKESKHCYNWIESKDRTWCSKYF